MFLSTKKWPIIASIIFSLITVENAGAAQLFTRFSHIKPYGKDVPSEQVFLPSNDVVTMNLESGFIITQIHLNGKGPYRFIIDTGSDVSIISYDVAKQLALKSLETRTRTFHTHQRQLEVETYRYNIDDLKVGNVILKNATILSSNAESDEFQLLKSLNVHGVLGENSFFNLVMEINLPDKKIILRDPKDFPMPAKGVIPLEDNYLVPMIETKIVKNNNETKQLFMIDTGYSGFAKMPECYANDNSPQNNDAQSHDIFNVSEKGLLIELDGQWIIGEVRLDRPVVKYEYNTCQNDKKWGLIGTQFLLFHKIIIDQSGRYVVLENGHDEIYRK